MRERLAKPLGILLVCLLLGAGALAKLWPTLLEGAARDKTLHALGARFDTVSMESFDLSPDFVRIEGLRLTKGEASWEFPKVFVSYEPHWGAGQVEVLRVQANAWEFSGTREALESLRSKSPAPTPSGSGRLVLRDAQVSLSGRVHLEGDDTSAEGFLSFSGPLFSPEVMIEQGRLSRGSGVQVSLDRADATLGSWPLDVQVKNLEARYEEIFIKGVRGSFKISDEAVQDLRFNLTGEGRAWQLNGKINRPAQEVSGTFVASRVPTKHFPLAGLPIDPDFGDVSADLSFSAEKSLYRAQGSLSVQGLRVDHPSLARDPVELSSDLNFRVSGDLIRRELTVHELMVRPKSEKPIELGVNGRVLYAKKLKDRELEVRAHMNPYPCQDVLNSAPPGLLPGLQDFKLAGTTSLDLHMKVLMKDADATVLEGGLNLDGCYVLHSPDPVDRLDGMFMHVTRMKDGSLSQVAMIPGHPLFVPWDQIPSSMSAAVVASEDGSFWRHRGYRPKSFFNSLRRNVELGTFQRGGSTITMQMVKNVLLSHERTVSRKLQELFLTWIVERKLSKSRIMEIYLNVVEFGPGIYGIEHAATHYFGKSAVQLTSLEAAFLATLLPRPLGRYEMYCHGKLTAKHASYVHRVHLRMLGSSRITQAEFDKAEEAGIQFKHLPTHSVSRCVEQARSLKRGEHTQAAISGLTPVQ